MRITVNNEAKIVSIAIAVLFILIALTSCGSRYHLKRANYHIAMAEAKGGQFHSDTLWRTIEIPIPEVSKDTIFKSSVGDTVIIEKDRLKVVYVKLPGDSVFIEGECRSDTIIKEVPTVIRRTIVQPAKGLQWWHVLLAFVAVAIIALIRKR
jgi:hypothetical protein